MTADVEAVLGSLPQEAASSRAVRATVVGAIAIGASLGCWLLALWHADLSKLDGYGLLTALPPSYYLGLVLLTAGFAYTATRTPARPGLLAAHVLALLVELHATTAVLYQEPRYSWVYKHLGVVDYIQKNGEVHRWIDIYHNWPALFAVTAWVADAAGVRPMALAPWAQVFFELLSVAAIVFAIRGVTRDPRRVWVAAWIFVIGNWIGQDYLSPQAFAFVLATVAIGLALRLARPESVVRRRIGDWIDRLVAGGPGSSPVEATGAPRAALLGACAVCSLGVVISHQLSPVFLILDLTALWVLTRRPSFWAIGLLMAAEVGWVALGWSFISTHFSLFDVSSSLNARGSIPAHPLPGVLMGDRGPTLSMLAVGGLAFCGFVRAWRAGQRLIVPAALAFSPFPLVMVQRYGGEGPIRAYLFALPWLALIAAWLFVPAGETRPGRGRSLLLAAATGAIAIGTLLAYFGQETLNRMSPDDVAASRWFLDNTGAGAGEVLFAPNFPERLDANYVDHIDDPTILLHLPGVAGPQFATRGLAALQRIARTTDKEEYVIVTPSQLQYLYFTGTAPVEAAQRLAVELERTPGFQLVFRSGRAEIFRIAS
jgi:hypothetical protein